MRSAAKRPASGWLTPAATNRPIFTLTGGCAADSPAMSATVMVRLHRSNDNLAVRGLRAARAHCGKRRLHFARDALLNVEFEAEIAARRDHDGGEQPGQEFSP